MKKLLLSLCLLGVVAPQTAQAFSFPIPSMIANLMSSPNAQYAALLTAAGWYYFIWKQRKPIAIDQEWSWSHIITRLGEDGYCQQVLTGNSEVKREVEYTTMDADTGLVTTVTEDEVTVDAYGIIGTLDTMFISKLEAFGKLLKAVGRTRDFVKNPFSLFSLSLD